MNRLLGIVLCCSICNLSSARTQIDRNRILDERLNRIDFYHIGVGVDVAAKQNYMLAPKVYAGIGSNRNLINADFGIKVALSNPFGYAGKEHIRCCAIPLFVSGSLNAVRWRQNSAYVGAEISYSLPVSSSHFGGGISGTARHTLASAHFSWQGKVGIKCRCWDFSVFYENDLSPAINQKYVYESPSFDYFTLRESIFERWRLGISISYSFRF